jgi:hypothetical protein
MAKLNAFEDRSAAAQLKALGHPMSLDVTRTLASLTSARELATAPTAFDLTRPLRSLVSSPARELALGLTAFDLARTRASLPSAVASELALAANLKATTSFPTTMSAASTLAEHSSYLAKLHASPLKELMGSIKAADIMGRMPVGMGGTFDRLKSIRSLLEPVNPSPLERVGLMSFVDDSPALDRYLEPLSSELARGDHVPSFSFSKSAFALFTADIAFGQPT